MWKIFSIPCGSALYKFHCNIKLYICGPQTQLTVSLFLKTSLHVSAPTGHLQVIYVYIVYVSNTTGWTHKDKVQNSHFDYIKITIWWQHVQRMTGNRRWTRQQYGGNMSRGWQATEGGPNNNMVATCPEDDRQQKVAQTTIWWQHVQRMTGNRRWSKQQYGGNMSRGWQATEGGPNNNMMATCPEDDRQQKVAQTTIWWEHVQRMTGNRRWSKQLFRCRTWKHLQSVGQKDIWSGGRDKSGRTVDRERGKLAGNLKASLVSVN
jgi:hypothetical protein